MTIRLDPAPGVGDCVPPFAESDGGEQKPAFMLNNEERLVVLDLRFIAPNIRGGMSAHRFTLFALKSFFLKALRHCPSLSTLHATDSKATEERKEKTSPTKNMSADEAQSDEGEEDQWEDAMEGSDDWVDESHSAVLYPFVDWQDRCRIIPDIPLQFAWVSLGFSCLVFFSLPFFSLLKLTY